MIKERYNEKSAGHLNINKIIELVIQNFMWPGIKQNVTVYIQSYNIYKSKTLKILIIQ